jgi:hypothetical protein
MELSEFYALVAAEEARKNALWDQKMPTSEYDEMTAPAMPTPEQQKVLGVKVIYGEPVEMHPPAYQQNYLPAEVSHQTAAEVINNVWQAVTPWAEEKGETFLDTVKDLPQAWINAQTPPKQADLAKVYAAESESPFWYKAIFGHSVEKNNDGTYSQVVQGELPMVSPAMFGLGAAKTAFKSVKPLLTVAPAEIGMADAQYLRFLNARISNPNLSAEGFKALDGLLSDAVKSGGSTFAKQQAISMGYKLSGVLQPGEEAAEIASGVSRVVKGSKIVDTAIDPYAMGGRVPTANWYQEVLATIKADKPAIQTAAKIEQSLSKVVQTVNNSTLTATQTARVLIDRGAVSAALATKTAATLQLLEAVSPALREAALVSVSEKVSDAITSGKSEATIQKIAQAEVVSITKAANKVAANSKTAIDLQPVTKAAIKSVSQTVPETQAQIRTDTELKQQTKTQTKTETQVKTSPKTVTETVTKAKIGKTTGKEIEPPVRPPTTKIPVFVLKLPGAGGEVLKLTAKEHAGIVAWRQGIFYIMKWEPYHKAHTRYTREAIPGVAYHDGIGSAAKSIVALRGEIPENIRFDMGIQDVNIFRGTGGRPDIAFKLDRNVKQGRKPVIRDQATVSSIKKSR